MLQPEHQWVKQHQLTPSGIRLMRSLDRCLREKSIMTDELRHFIAVVHKSRLMKPVEWLETYPEKADALWSALAPVEDESDDRPPQSGINPWLITR